MKKYSVNKVNVVLGFCLILLQFYDIYMTLTALNHGAIEINPIVLFFMERFGVFKGLILAKFLVICLIIMLAIFPKEHSFIKRLLIIALATYVVVLGYLTISNYSVLF